MKKISSAYWKKFINIDSDGNEKGNGIEFENLVNCLLVSMYRKKWVVTGGSHDNNRDFWLYSENQHLWAECSLQSCLNSSFILPVLIFTIFTFLPFYLFAYPFYLSKTPNHFRAFQMPSLSTSVVI